MGELLNEVLEAHGGLERWNRAEAITATLSLGGPFAGWRGLPSILRPQTLTVYAHKQLLTLTPFTGDGWTARFDNGHVRLTDADGDVLDDRPEPLATFPAYTDAVQWDPTQLAYFMGAANWGYFTEPFLFTYPGVTATEIEPWTEDGETWRRLAVTFPADLPSHNPDQVFYYGDDRLLRRMDYAPEVTGGGPIAHYASDPVTVDGLVFYRRRAVHLRDAATNLADRSWAPITLGTDGITVS